MARGRAAILGDLRKLQREVAELGDRRLGRQVGSLVGTVEHMREPDPAPPAPRSWQADFARVMADEELVELHRRAAWCERTSGLQHWDDELRDFRWPSDWPEGLDAQTYIAGKVRGDEADDA